MAGPQSDLAAILKLGVEGQASWDKAEKQFGSLESKFGGIGAKASVAGVGIAALGAVIAAAAVKAFELGEAFDAAYDRIRAGTGQTGQALEGLQQTFRNITADSPDNLDKISTAVTALYQRLKLTGEPLEALAQQELALSRITGTDLAENLRLTTRLFGDWSVATADQSRVLDELFRASQTSGASVDQLAQTVVQFGAPLRQLGFTLEESLALMAKWDAEGVNSETVLAGMRHAVASLSEAHIPLEDGFRALVQIIGSMGDATEATALAMKVFGTKAGPDMAAAIREGRFAVEDMVGAITDGSDTIQGAVDDTEDGAEKWARAQNRMALAMAPVAAAVFDTATKIVENLIPPLQTSAKWIEPFIKEAAALVGWMNNIGEAIDRAIEALSHFPDVFRDNTGDRNKPPEGDGTKTLPMPAGLANLVLPASGRSNPADFPQFPAEVANEVEQKTAAAAPVVKKSAEELAAEYYDTLLKAFGPKGEKPTQVKTAVGRSTQEIAKITETAIQGFMSAASSNLSRWESIMGEFGGKGAAALEIAIVENSKSSGEALRKWVDDAATKMREAGITDFQDVADALAGTFHDVLVDRGNPAAKAAAIEMIRTVTETIKAAGALTAESFATAFEAAGTAQALGGQGASLMAAMETAIKDGGVKNIRALADTVAGMRTTLLQNSDLSPDRAEELFGQVFDAINTAITEGTDEARANLQTFLAAFDLSVQLEAISARNAAAISTATVNAQQAITQAYANRDEAVKRLYTNQAIQQYDRSQQQAEDAWITAYLADTQKYVDGENAKIQANRQRAQNERQELRETADLEKSYQEAREALLKKQESTGTASTSFKVGMGGVQTQQHTDPAAAFAQQLKDLDTQHVKDVANLAARQAQRRADHAEDVKWQAEDKAVADALTTVLTNAQTSAQVINQQFRDTYQLNVIIPRQINDLTTQTASDVARINTDLGTLTDKLAADTSTMVTRLQYLHDTVMPGLKSVGDTWLDGAVADSAQVLQNILAANAAQGGNNARYSTGSTTPTVLPDNSFTALAGGGIVTRPTFALIGEHGPEAVVPLSGGSKPELHVHVEIGGQEIQHFVIDTVQQASRRGEVLTR